MWWQGSLVLGGYGGWYLDQSPPGRAISDSSDLNPTMTVAVVVWDRT